MRIKVKLRREKMSERRGEDSDWEGIQQQKGGGVVIAEVMRGIVGLI